MAKIQQVRLLLLDSRIFQILDRLQDLPRHLERSNLEAEENFGSQIVPDAVEVLLVQQDFADGPVETRIGEVG